MATDRQPPPTTDNSRREFVKRAAYVAPAVLTLTAVSAVAKAGSAPPRGRPNQPRPPRPPRRRPGG